MDTNALIQELANSAAPVRRLPAPWARMLLWLVLSVPFLAVIIWLVARAHYPLLDEHTT